MARWLVKTDPTLFGWDEMCAAGRTIWDGVRSPAALVHLRRFGRGDQVLVYHAGRERAVVGIARAWGDARPDPGESDPRLVIVELEPVRRLARGVARRELAARARLAAWELVRTPRLTVLPVPAVAWRTVLRLASAPGRRPPAGPSSLGSRRAGG